MNLRFYKESDNRWYVDLPEWTGDKSDLEMVYGADTMLDYMSQGELSINVRLSEEFFEHSDKLEFIREATELGNGAYYKLEKYKSINIDLYMWLCDVTKFVFGDFPKIIYISNI